MHKKFLQKGHTKVLLKGVNKSAQKNAKNSVQKSSLHKKSAKKHFLEIRTYMHSSHYHNAVLFLFRVILMASLLEGGRSRDIVKICDCPPCTRLYDDQYFLDEDGFDLCQVEGADNGCLYRNEVGAPHMTL